MYTCLRVSGTLELESQDQSEFFPLLDFFPHLISDQKACKALENRLGMISADGMNRERKESVVVSFWNRLQELCVQRVGRNLSVETL